MSAMLFLLTLFTLATLVFCNNHALDQRRDCNAYCNPAGAVANVLPQVGTALADLYSALINSINTSSKEATTSDGPAKRQDKLIGFCCAREGQCYLLQEYNIPFCYDEFTTNYQFPDGSYGSVVTGNFTSSSGVNVDLVYGSYKDAQGSPQNIYTSKSKPDTSTMPMPTPWTSSGVGTAIPASELGGLGTISTTSADSIVTAITLSSLTITAGSSACALCPNNQSLTITGPGIPLVTGNTTATASSNGSTGGASMIIPPITNNWAKSYEFWSSKLTLLSILAVFIMLSI